MKSLFSNRFRIIFFIICIFLIPPIYAQIDYSDCTIYGNCKSITLTSSGGNVSTTIVNGSNLFTSLNETQFDNSTGVLNLIETWLKDIIESYNYIATWFVPDASNNFLSNDSTYLYFNETKLNDTINNYVTTNGLGGNSSFNQTLTDTLYAGIEWDYNQTPNLTAYAKLDGTNQPFTGNLNISKYNPEYILTHNITNNYARLLKTGTTNFAYQYNKIEMPPAAGKALSFVGASSEHVTTGTSSALWGGGTGGVISCWIKADDLATTDGIFGGGISNGYLYKEAQKLAIQMRDSINTNDNIWRTTNNVITATGTWYHIAFKFPSSGNTGQFYVNGAPVATTKVSGTGVAPWRTSTDTKYIGAQIWSGSPYNYFDGDIDEFVIWNRELSDAEVAELYTVRKVLATDTFASTSNSKGLNLTLLYHFDEGSGTVAGDSSGNNRNGTLVNTPTWVDGIVGGLNSVEETVVWSSKDGTDALEKGIQTFGDIAGRTVLAGKTLRFNIGSTQYWQVDTSGDLISTTASIKLGADGEEVIFGTGYDASIKYDGTNLVFNTSKVGTGLAWFSNNISTTGVLTRTSVFDKSKTSKTALEYIKDSSEYLNADGSINHDAFEYSKVEYPVSTKEVLRNETIIVNECNYDDRVESVVCEDVEKQVEVVDYETVMETGVNLGDEVALLKQAIYELKQQNLFLQEQINNLTGKDVQIDEANTRQDEALCTIKIFSWCIK